ncbi:unnamed protein product [Brassica rapa]|uniref:Uncharacterized protein n=1 Tax=Brassica campestris TaxID=3711 RepID=A0A8D9H9F1_BRACM|nr:unnamed protein product [Brassica rapa]
MLWPHSHAIANHFPIGHPSFHYSRSSTLNSGVLSGCVPEKENLCQTAPPKNRNTQTRTLVPILSSSSKLTYHPVLER